jgi:hypothetical protein
MGWQGMVIGCNVRCANSLDQKDIIKGTFILVSGARDRSIEQGI